MNIDKELFNFVNNSIKRMNNDNLQDNSHGIDHAIIVTLNAHEIMKSICTNYDEKLLTYIGMCHDLRDHKYPNCISETEFSEFTTKYLSPELCPIVIKIINNVSFSKEDKGLRENLEEPYNNYLIAVSDADKLEAIGKIGIQRCINYNSSRGGNIPEDVIKHCNEKLLRLLPEGFIRTELGKQMAKQLHKEIEEYINNNNNNIIN
jgi:uncharacterized protein